MQKTHFKLSIFVASALIGVALVFYFEPVAKDTESAVPSASELPANEVFPTTPPAKVGEIACSDPVSERFLNKMLGVPEIADGLHIDTNVCSENLRHTKIDLNGDGLDEHILWVYVSAMCGSKSNCPTAIFSETSNGLRELYYHPAKGNLTALNSRSKGYRNIESSFNKGVYGQYVEILRFDGDRYQVSKCLQRHPDETVERVECGETQ